MPVLHLTDVARRTVQPDHLVAIQLRAAERDPDWQAIRITLVPAIGKKAKAFDVVEKSPDVNAAIVRRYLDVEREEPVEGKELAALRQVIEIRAVGVGQRCSARRRVATRAAALPER